MWERASAFLVFDGLGFSPESALGQAVHFFLYDTVKIGLLLLAVIFLVSFLRTWFSTEKVRLWLHDKHPALGYLMAALFGIVTPFCTCSAIPLFLGFLQARIPVGVTFSFLISAPMNNEVAIAMLLGLFGWKVAAVYVALGLAVAVVGGFLLEKIGAARWVLIQVPEAENLEGFQEERNMNMRLKEAWSHTREIGIQVMPYVVLGVAAGAAIHGYVPTDLIARYAGGDGWWTVPAAVLLGVPMYAGAAGVMPLVEVLTAKGMLLGSALAFMMAVTALSLPEAMILKRILHLRLILLFFAIVGGGIMINGYLFNTLFHG